MDHLLDIETIPLERIDAILDKARDIKSEMAKGRYSKKPLEGRIIFSMFLENSTRTRTSFDMAVHRLGGAIIHWDNNANSLKKGETLTDTIRCVSSYKPDGLIVRSSEFKAPYTFKALMNCPIINAGDSYRAHPSQALLDTFTIEEQKARIDGLTIAICGDIAHSRVAACNIQLLHKKGAKLRLISPPALTMNRLPFEDIETFTDMDEGIRDCDVIMMLRNQKERMEASAIPDDDWYFRNYGLTQDRLAFAKDDVMVMHPAPMNRGVEIADDVADDPLKSFIFKQMENGLPVRMAILETLVS